MILALLCAKERSRWNFLKHCHAKKSLIKETVYGKKFEITSAFQEAFDQAQHHGETFRS